MKTVIYLDVLLLVNFVVGHLLLRAAAFACGSALLPLRGVLGAAAASLSTLVLFLPPMPLPLQLLCRAGGALLAVRLAFPWQGAGGFVRRWGWYLALNLGLAGLLLLLLTGLDTPGIQTNNLAFYVDISPTLLAGSALAVYLAVRGAAVFRQQGRGGQIGTAQVVFPDGTALTLRVLRDTGFLARDPLSGSWVLLVSWPMVRRELPLFWQKFLVQWLSGGCEAKPPPGLRLRCIPLHTASGELLAPAFCGDLTLGQKRQKGVPVAFSPQRFSDGAFNALAGEGLWGESP